ncbi:hypothetical protein G7046_g5044 [Stylonectria norvegica]|nr:hypothetical protein G7046_g5044 [Stylonectria norvegica]
MIHPSAQSISAAFSPWALPLRRVQYEYRAYPLSLSVRGRGPASTPRARADMRRGETRRDRPPRDERRDEPSGAIQSANKKDVRDPRPASTLSAVPRTRVPASRSARRPTRSRNSACNPLSGPSSPSLGRLRRRAKSCNVTRQLGPPMWWRRGMGAHTTNALSKGDKQTSESFWVMRRRLGLGPHWSCILDCVIYACIRIHTYRLDEGAGPWLFAPYEYVRRPVHAAMAGNVTRRPCA